MATVERQEDGPEGRGDLRDRIHGVGLEVERVRTEMAEMETKLMEKMGDLEAKLSDRIDGVEKNPAGLAGVRGIAHRGDDCPGGGARLMSSPTGEIPDQGLF